MTRRKIRGRLSLVALALAAVATAMYVGCADDDSTPRPKADAGFTDVGVREASSAPTLYERLGKRAGIAATLDAVLDAELKNPDVASYFFFQERSGADGGLPADGHPSMAQIKACLVNQIANASGGPEAYPGQPDASAGWQCRPMAAAHASLGIPSGVFEAFLGIAVGVLRARGLSEGEIAELGKILSASKTAIVQDTTRDGGPFDASAFTGSDASTD